MSSVAVLYDVAESYSRHVAEDFRRVFEEAGGRVVAYESFAFGEQDFTPQLERIRDAGPEALFLPNFSEQVIVQGRQARRLGLDAVLLGSDSWLPEPLTAHRELEGAFFSLSWHRDLARESSEAADFIARYRRATGREPEEKAALTYDAFGLLFRAIGDAPRADPESIRDALSRIEDHRGVTGAITYRGRGGDPPRKAVIVRIEEGELRLFAQVEAEPED